MRIISGNTINETIHKAFRTVNTEGLYKPSRNGGCTALYNTIFQIENPRSRHLNLKGRKSNIYALMAETFWVMAGANAVSPYLDFFLPRAPQYSDDGVVWHGAYGPRLYAHDQLLGMVEDFRTDGKATRRSQAVIYDAALDSPSAIADMYGEDHKAKDRPCNSMMYAYITPDDKFHLHVTQRSGDLLFGTGSINPFEFTFLQELLFNEVRLIHPEIELGYYSWYVNDAHVYDAFKDQVQAVLHQHQTLGHQNHMPLKAPRIEKWQDFFGEIVAHLSFLINDESTLDDFYLGDLQAIFYDYNVPVFNNLLFQYVALVYRYILQKRFPHIPVSYEIDNLEYDEVIDSVLQSSFTKFKVY